MSESNRKIAKRIADDYARKYVSRQDRINIGASVYAAVMEALEAKEAAL